MPLWAERQVKRDLGFEVHRRKRPTFKKLFQTPPHVEFTAREPKTAHYLRRLMGSNVVEFSNVYMEKLEHQTERAYREDLQVRIAERAHQAEHLAHIQLWESVLRGESDLPPEKLDDPCMRTIRQHQLRIEAIHQKAAKLGTSVQRVATMPSMWFERRHYKTERRKERSLSPTSSESLRSYDRLQLGRSSSPTHSRASSTTMSRADSRVIVRSDSWRSRQILIKMSDEARAKRWKGNAPTAGFGTQYRRLTGESDADVIIPPHSSEKVKKTVTMAEDVPRPRDRRLSRINPPRRPPVTFPLLGPRFLLLSCDAEGGRGVMKALGTSDFIIPRYFQPRALNLLRAAKNLDELYRLSNDMFVVQYPPIDNRDWNSVFSSRIERKAALEKQARVSCPIRPFRLVK